MTKKTIFAVLVASLVTGAVAAPVVAQSDGDRSERTQNMRDGDRDGQRNRMGHSDQQRGMFENYDTNADGALTQDEIDTVRAERLAEFDADGDSQLTLEEYQALWLDAMFERMVDQFQRHDDDGDGFVTAAEFGEDFADIVAQRDRNGDGVLNADDRRQRGAPAADDAE